MILRKINYSDQKFAKDTIKRLYEGSAALMSHIKH